MAPSFFKNLFKGRESGLVDKTEDVNREGGKIMQEMVADSESEQEILRGLHKTTQSAIESKPASEEGIIEFNESNKKIQGMPDPILASIERSNEAERRYQAKRAKELEEETAREKLGSKNQEVPNIEFDSTLLDGEKRK